MSIKEYINYQVSSVLLEIKSTFKWDEFKSLNTLEEKFEYAQNNLQKLGAGSSRATFLLSSRYVLKVAIPQSGAKGTGQNKSELQIFANPASKNVVTNIYDADNDHHWLVSEIARPIKNETEFKKLTGVDWEEFVSIIDNYKNIKDDFIEFDEALRRLEIRLFNAKSVRNKTLVRNISKKIENINQKKQALENNLNIPFIKGALSLMNDAGLLPGDLTFVNHWGKTADGRVVLLDYGLTEDLAYLYKKQAG